MLADKHTRNAHLWCDPSDHMARDVWAQDALVRTHLWSTMMKAFPRGNELHNPKLADGNAGGQLALCPQVLICPPPSNGPSQHNEPRIQSLDSQVPSHEDISTREPEPEVAPTQSKEEAFACPATPHSVIIIDNTPVGSHSCPPPPLLPQFLPWRSQQPPHAQRKAPLIPTMRLGRNLPTCD
ncbi:hypothetical protein O181_058792 [Austropuccinia psidii MF-1]|uniref:Uncharacterized protein n=1 Tax=Austropuccinia psidii MF-1 TaxID=1389203 RepID=A0A9Q3EKH9_9BASI|nr:hypothetical protein [Austropuccinia psidii MF-1]